MSWRPPAPMGYLESIQAVGGFAAPLLAGGSFTLAVLALQSSVPGPAAVSRWPNAALLLFVAAGLLQIGTVQATAWTRRYMCTPGDLLQWFPDKQDDGVPHPPLLTMQQSHMRHAYRWAAVARGFFHVGVLALLGGLLTACVPPGSISTARWAVLVVCAGGMVGELAWLARAVFLDQALRRDVWPALGTLLAVLLSAAVPLMWHGGAARVGAVVLLGVFGIPEVRRRAGLCCLSLVAGAVALALDAPHPLVVLALLPAFVSVLLRLVALFRRQRLMNT
ncbi:hypothetical protein ACIBF1_09030 [Spirillospora sp. NPDC050679]